jgi:hypothetical protein
LCSPGSTCKHDYWKFSTKKSRKIARIVDQRRI